MGDPSAVSCSELVRRTVGGEKEAYGELVARYQGHVYGLAYSLVGDWASAQDVAQETFIRAYCNLDQLREPENFPAWLRRVTSGVAMNWPKAFRPDAFKQIDGKVDLDALEIPDFHSGPAEVTEKRELAEAVLKAVASLPPKYRVPLTMFHLDGLSYQKVAEFLDIPLGTAKSLIHRAQEKLRAALPPALVKEMAMVQEVFNEHKLPDEFASRVLEKVPKLRWGSGKECTFVGALEAALSVTEHPYKYTDLMGFTGLAFRVRWFKSATIPPWCSSCAIGEGDEETAAARGRPAGR
jgi:RNA polymerase sigma-70 factor (ECF subfamily)